MSDRTPERSLEGEPLRVVIVGHVDHGKSTLVGRLFHDTGSLPEGKFEEIEAMCERRGMPFEWAFLMDALQAERDQGITIDVSHIWFKTAKRDYVIIDAPGHKEFLKNMVSGAASADAALLVIDAHEGVQEQSRRHGYLLHLLGVRQVVVAINKMDLVDYSRDRFVEVEEEYRSYLAGIGVEAQHIVPVSSREGDCIVTRSEKMGWYQGPTIVEALDGFRSPLPQTELPLRLPIQDVYKFDNRRLIVGRIESGRLRVGDMLVLSPSNKSARVASIESWNIAAPLLAASAGQSVAITLQEQIFVERGQIASHEDNLPVETNVFRANIFWLGKNPLGEGSRYTLKPHTGQHRVEVQSIDRIVDVVDLSSGKGVEVPKNAVAEITLRIRGMVALDAFTDNIRTGRFVLVEDYAIVGGGIINMDGYPDQRQAVTQRATNVFQVEHRVAPASRWGMNGHRSGVVWLTGLSGSGKTTLAIELESQLFRKGYQVYVLDGDNLRNGLNANLGFTPEDRTENIRRAGQVAALFADAGFLVITAFISPYQADRDRVRAIAPDGFHEVYVKASLETCEERDPKGLYQRARSGEIAEFTGISSPYEAPVGPELTIDTDALTVEEAVASLLEYVEKNLVAGKGWKEPGSQDSVSQLAAPDI